MGTRNDLELLKSLDGFQQELSSAGALNGTAQAASRAMAEAHQRGIELSKFEALSQWDEGLVVNTAEFSRFLDLLGRNDAAENLIVL